MDELIFNKNPTISQLNQLEMWLIEEEELLNDGFYCSWKRIFNSIIKKEIILLLISEEVIGFSTWYSLDDFSAVIDIVEIKPSYRKKGLGRKLITHLFNFFTSKNIIACTLQCAPANSEFFWRKLDFQEIHFQNHGDLNKEMYKVLVPNLYTVKNKKSGEFLELWYKDKFASTSEIPDVTWEIKREKLSNILIDPIIHPCNSDFRLIWRKNKKIFFDNRVKLFSNTETHPSNFLFIKYLEKK